MSYISKETLFNSREYLNQRTKKTDTLIGLIVFLFCVQERKEQGRYLLSDMGEFAHVVDEAFYLLPSITKNTAEPLVWYGFISENWLNEVKLTFLNNNKISAKHVVNVLFWRKSFSHTNEAVEWFKNKITPVIFNELFELQENSGNDFVNDKAIDVSDIIKHYDGNNQDLTLKSDGKFIKKKASDLSAAPFGQTLYAASEIKKVILITPFDFIEKFTFTSFVRQEKPKNLISNNNSDSKLTQLPKTFLILAGISGTGKTRFVREQAKLANADNQAKENYCLVSVRPDWHEPSDLLGYISHLGSKPKYITTDVLRFIVQAWKHIADSGFDLKTGKITEKQLNEIQPYWLCLDEMNLAPVEQYFADYLSILETRQWSGEVYQCDPLLKSSVLENIQPADFGLDEGDILWGHFKENGISIPFNLIVAGTVNMDETTHGFSRKVLDRALSFDFNEFYPNDFNTYFLSNVQNRTFTYPIYSDASLSLNFDSPFVQESCEFLSKINVVLKHSPFELAYRALNELLLSVKCINPKNEIELQSIWDDFLMMKILPRIEGDSEKLDFDGEKSLLTNLEAIIKEQLSDIWEGEKRIDLFRETNEGDVINIACRSKAKISWMQTKLEKFGFTHFWK